jgi:hypothetical protein
MAQSAPVLIAAEKAEQLPAPDKNEKKSSSGKAIVPGPPAYATTNVSRDTTFPTKIKYLPLWRGK